MRISFCLPIKLNYPAGGYKIIYEYANRLSRKGHIVNILYDMSNWFSDYQIPSSIKNFGKSISAKQKVKWFKLDKSVRCYSTNAFKNNQVPEADIVVATSVVTAKPVSMLDSSKGKKYYFIQGYENWVYGNDVVNSTYRLGMTNIVIANWLKEKVELYSNKKAYLLLNAIDKSVFDIDCSISERNRHSICFLNHNGEYKGVKYTLEVVKLLKNRYEDLKVISFGVPERTNELFEWIEYYRNANQLTVRNIYNRSSVFLCSSINDGFGLTGAESMACGCCLISSDYLGVHEYAEDGINALLSPMRDIKSMYNNVVKVMEDDGLRLKLANRGYEDISKITWDEQVKKLESLFFMV